MPRDPVFRSFLESAAADAREVNRTSRCVRLVPDPRSGSPSDTYHCIFDGLQYFKRAPDGTIAESRDPLLVRIRFPEEYLRDTEPGLAYRTISVVSSLHHPNVRGSAVCLAGFAVGTRLRSIAEMLHAVFSARVYATSDPLDPEAARFFADHPERVHTLRSAPLWPTPVGRVSRVRSGAPGEVAP